MSACPHSKGHLEAEKRTILKQRIPVLDIEGTNGVNLRRKANELHLRIVRLASKEYDMNKRLKEQ